MKWTNRIFVAVAAVACLSAEERKVVDLTKKDPKDDRSTSASKHIDPSGQIKSSVDMRKALEASSSGKGKEEKKTDPPPKDTGKDKGGEAAPPPVPNPPGAKPPKR